MQVGQLLVVREAILRLSEQQRGAKPGSKLPGFHLTLIPFYLCCVTLGIGVTVSAAGQVKADPSELCNADAMIVLDASGSMAASDFPEGAPNRMDRVRQALARVVPQAAPVRRLGLVTYGPGTNANSCRNVDVKFSPTIDAGSAILDIAGKLRPGGRTPLTVSVEQAWRSLKESPRPAQIVVLTDGEDTCGGDPCGLARRIAAQDPDLSIHVVGFRLPTLSETAGVRCLADETGGVFVTTETTDALIEALRQTLACAQVSQTAR